MNKRAMAIYDVFTQSNYKIVAAGWRDPNSDELMQLCNILSGKCDDVLKKSRDLYKYNPDTINLDKSAQKRNCSYFDESVCRCYHPDFKGECWYRKIIEQDNQRDRNTVEYKEWRSKVFERDNYTCQDCNKKGGELNAHHIKSYATFKELRHEVDNGITLCEGCHKLRHKRR